MVEHDKSKPSNLTNIKDSLQGLYRAVSKGHENVSTIPRIWFHAFWHRFSEGEREGVILDLVISFLAWRIGANKGRIWGPFSQYGR